MAATNSAFTTHKNERNEKLASKTIALRSEIQKTSSQSLDTNAEQFDALVNYYKRRRNISRCMVHVDLDAFYAQCEMLRNPELMRVPMAVGGESMLSTANYEARKYGVYSGIPGFKGKQLCPRLRIVPLDFDLYRRASWTFHKALKTFNPEVYMVGLDEAYFDVTELVANRLEPEVLNLIVFDGDCLCNRPRLSDLQDGDEHRSKHERVCHNCSLNQIRYYAVMHFGLGFSELVRQIRMEVALQTNMSCSAGGAYSVFLAKVCSDIQKPNGQFVLPNQEEAIDSFLLNCKINMFQYVGPRTVEKLNQFDIETVRDLVLNKDILRALTGESQFELLARVVSAADAGRYEEDDELIEELQNPSGQPPIIRSDGKITVGHEETFSPTDDRNKLLKNLKLIANAAIRSALSDGATQVGSMVIKIKFSSFNIRHVSTKFGDALPLNITLLPFITKPFFKFLDQSEEKKIRLIGVRFGDLKFGVKYKVQQSLMTFVAHNQESERSRKRMSLLDSEGDSKRAKTASTIGDDDEIMIVD